MQTAIYTFGSADTADVVSAAPSGARYVLLGLATSSGNVTAITSTTSGVYAVTNNTSPLTNLRVYPSGNLGYNEALAVTATAPCTVMVTYILQAPKDSTNQFGYTAPLEEYSNRVVPSGWLNKPVQSGSFRSGFGG